MKEARSQREDVDQCFVTLIGSGRKIDDSDRTTCNPRCIVRKPLKSNLKLRRVDNAVESVTENVRLRQTICWGPNAEWFIKHEFGAYGLVVQDSPNVDSESNCGIRDLLFDMALDECAIGKRIWSA